MLISGRYVTSFLEWNHWLGLSLNIPLFGKELATYSTVSNRV